MKKLFSLLLLFSLSGCAHRLGVGDCYLAHQGEKNTIFKIEAVGSFGAKVVDFYGDEYTTKGFPDSTDQVDCFSRFDKVK